MLKVMSLSKTLRNNTKITQHEFHSSVCFNSQREKLPPTTLFNFTRESKTKGTIQSLTMETCWNSNPRPIRSLSCKTMKMHRRCYSSEKQPDNRGEQTKWLMTYITGIAMLLLARYYYRKNYLDKDANGCETKKGDLKMYQKAAQMIEHRGYILPEFVKKELPAIEDFPVNDDDVFVVSFPKSGTTWVQEIVYLIHSGVDVHKAREQIMDDRFPYLEFVYPGVKEVARQASPRLVKTHLPYELLPEKLKQNQGKMIYIARNPKDTCVSYYHFQRMFTVYNYRGDFATFLHSFLRGDVHYGPWWKHVTTFWKNRDHANLLFITYEELQKDLPRAIRKIAAFLGKSLTEKKVTRIAELSTFSAMKANPSTNYAWMDELGLRRKGESTFMRKGEVGDWRNYFTADMEREVADFCAEHIEPHGLNFDDERP